MRKQAAPVILVFIVRRRGIIRQLVHVLDEDDARDALAAGEAVCGHVEGLRLGGQGGDTGLGVLDPFVDPAGRAG